jgi:hypothetical protein
MTLPRESDGCRHERPAGKVSNSFNLWVVAVLLIYIFRAERFTAMFSASAHSQKCAARSYISMGQRRLLGSEGSFHIGYLAMLEYDLRRAVLTDAWVGSTLPCDDASMLACEHLGFSFRASSIREFARIKRRDQVSFVVLIESSHHDHLA